MSENYKILHGDSLYKLKELEDNSIDAIVTDPPAGISFMNKEWDKDKGGRDKWIEWMSKIANECFRVIKPGGYAFVWALPRTSHWTAMAWENGGFEPRDKIIHAFGNGFPKSQNIAKMIERKLTIGSSNTTAFKLLKGERKKIINGYTKMEFEQGNKPKNYNNNENGGSVINPIFTTEQAQKYIGFGTAIKPASEDWWLFRKPLSEKTIVENIIKWNVGGLNIEGCRIAPINMTKGGCKFKSAYFESGESNFSKDFDETKGRFPANLIWSHHRDCKLVGTKKVNSNAHYPEMNVTGYGKNFGGKTEYLAEGERPKTEMVESWECVEGCPSKEFDKAGITKTKANENYKWNNINCENANTFIGRGVYTPRNDEGTPARFFKSFSYEEEDFEYPPFYYCAKPSKKEKNEGLDDFEEKEMPHSTNMKCSNCGLPILCGTGQPTCKCENKQEIRAKSKNFHPTVKSVQLCRYLCKLITPKGGIVLDPFMGSGSIGVGAIKEGYKFVGIELTEEYIPIAEARIKHAIPTQTKLEVE